MNVALLVMLWMCVAPAADPPGPRVFALPHGGELLVVPSEVDEVVAVLVAPEGWASPEMPTYAKLAWSFPEAAQVDLRFLEVAAPGHLGLRMESDHSLAIVSGAAPGPRFTALAAAAFKREAPYHARWYLEGLPLDTAAELAAVLATGGPAAEGEVTSGDFTTVLRALNRHPDRVLVVAGDVTEDEALDLARATLSPVTDRPHVFRLLPEWPTEPVTLTRSELDSTWQIWGWPALLGEDRAPGALLWQVLQERITRTIRSQRGWTYSVVATQPTGPEGSACHMAIATPPEVAQDAHDLLEQELRDLAGSGPTAEELDRARVALLARIADGHSPGALGVELAIQRLRTGQWSAPEARLEDMAAVTPEDARAQAKRWLVEGPRARVRIDPK